jgi:hypothetical protein
VREAVAHSATLAPSGFWAALTKIHCAATKGLRRRIGSIGWPKRTIGLSRPWREPCVKQIIHDGGRKS